MDWAKKSAGQGAHAGAAYWSEAVPAGHGWHAAAPVPYWPGAQGPTVSLLATGS